MNRFLPFCLVCVWGAFFIARASALPTNPPPFAGKTLPPPPRQHSPWSPPEGLPGPLVSATIALFQEGMADPRGGEYRQISVAVGNAWNGGGEAFQTHGWVLPRSAKLSQTGPRFAVCWNGLVYPVASVGDRADLSADVQAMVSADAVREASQKKAGPTEPYFRFLNGAIPESQSVSETALLPIKVCLLMRLGEGKLAQTYWNTWLVGTPPNYNGNTEARRDPYLTLADEWVWAQFDRAVTAHMRGDDQLSLLTARQLTAVQPQAEAEAKRRGSTQFSNGGIHDAKQPYYSYLDNLPSLLADEERRAMQTKMSPVLVDILKIPAKPARIAALIGALDEVAARQMGQPGGVSPDADPLVLALVAQGEDAVEPLIHTLNTDTRLTRSVGFGRDFFQGRYFISVSGAADAALDDILQTSEFGPDGIQAYWNKNKGVPLEERWYRTLADDAASPKQWIEAAHEIIRPTNEKVRGGWVVTTPPAAGITVLPQGELLRQAHTPSVSDLIAQRVHDIVAISKTHSNDSRHVFEVEDATEMALYLAAWDPKAARPTLHDQFITQRETLLNWVQGSTTETDASNLTKLTLARVGSGDPAALNDYLDWLKISPFKNLSSFSFAAFFEPLWLYPDDPAVVRGADFLFLNPHSEWVPPTQNRPNINPDMFSVLLESPLLDLAAFRQAAMIALKDRAVVQTVTIGGPDQYSDDQIIRHDHDLYRPATAEVFPVRRCDLYAWHLSHLDGMPAFQYDWPAAKKDAAVAETTARLRRYGARFGIGHEVVRPGEGGYGPEERAFLRFPRLDHPATAADVTASRAIFSLAAGARVWPLPKFPLPARWLTDHRYPRQETVWSVADKKYEPGLGYSQDGMVWQAEETADGHRFYGFVGPHDIARVPAEEIEFPPVFPDYYEWPPVTAFLDAGARTGDGTFSPYLLTVQLTDPVPVTLRLRSRKGLTQTVPADFLKTHVTPSLLFSPDDPNAPPLEPGDLHRVWTAVPPRAAAPMPPAVAQTLAPTEEYAAWTFNLKDDYDLSRPGTYRFQFVFADQPTESGAPPPEVTLRVPR